MPAADLADPSPRARSIDYPRVGLLSLGHLTNDMYGNLLISLTPYLVIRGDISTAAAGLVLLVYLIGSSVLQPIFGMMSDRSGRRLFAILGPLWIGAAASVVGWTSGSAMLLIVAFIGGIGTAAFHPQAASMVDRLSNRSKGWVMSIFSMGGNLGFALGPLLAAAIAMIGLHYSLLAIIPGILVTILLVIFAPRVSSGDLHVGSAPIRTIAAASWRPLSLVVGIIAVRGAVQSSLILFLPLFFHARGLPAELGSYSAFLLSLAAAVGALAGGRLSDIYGRRPVVVTSLLVSVPILIGALLASGPLTWPLIVLGGGTLMASNSVTVVQGQEILPANTGIASGLTLGLGFGLSGVIASVMAGLAGLFGVQTIIFLLPFLAPIAALIAWFVPDRVRRGSSAERATELAV